MDFGETYNDRNIEKPLMDQAIDLINRIHQEPVLHEIALQNLVSLQDEIETLINLTIEEIEKEEEIKS